MSPPPRQRPSRRLLSILVLILFGGLALAGGAAGLVSERNLRARALPADAEIVGYARLVSSRGGELIGEPNALELRYRDAQGRVHPAILPRAGNEDLGAGSRVAVIYDPEDPGRVRRADRPADEGFMWALAAGGAATLLFGMALAPGLRRRRARPDAAESREIGPLPDGVTPHRFFALAGRPLMETRTAAGGADLYALDMQTGAFLPARDLWPRLSDGAIDLDQIDEGLFRQLGRQWRQHAMDARTARVIAWSATGDGEYPWRTQIDGHETRIRINDFPAEPLYSVIIAEQSVGELEDWPESWVKG